MTEFPFTLDGFSQKRLSVRLPGVFKGAVLAADGLEQPRVKGRYHLTDDSGRSREIVLKFNVFDALPSIQIDSAKATPIAPKLAWYEQVWSALPFGLIAVGGALGGALGFVGLSLNTRIFRTREGASRYALAALVTFGTFAVYVIGATLIRGLIGSD